jgi:hypothetical protein
MATRWDEENVNLQCAGCNTFRGGEQYLYGLALDKRYGRGTAAKLAKQAKIERRFTVTELEEIIHDSTAQIMWYLGTAAKEADNK